MVQTKVTRTIAAPCDAVFEAVAHIDQFSQIVPEIVRVEILSSQKRGVGTRFRETRLHGKRETTMELEVTEYQPPNHIRIVCDNRGTLWDTTFTVVPQGLGSCLTMTMDAKAYKLLPRLINPLIRSFVESAVARDMDAVKSWCEKAR